MIHLVTDIIVPRREAQVEGLNEVFTPEPQEYRVDIYWSANSGGGVAVSDEQLNRVRDAVQGLLEAGSVESVAFDYEYGSERGTHDPGPDVDIPGSVNVRVFHKGSMDDYAREEIENGDYVGELLLGELGIPREDVGGGHSVELTSTILRAEPDNTLVGLEWG